MLADVPGSSALDPSSCARASRASSPRRPRLPERLLSSAYGKLWSADPDPQTAVFLAVAACETKVKTILGTGTVGHGKPLLHYLDAATNRPPGTRCANAQLWDGLKDLITTRNKVTHRGETLTRPQAEAHLATAAAVFAWLESLTRPGPVPRPSPGTRPPA